MCQQFYLADETWVSACSLEVGDHLFDGRYILESEIIAQPCTCYSLSTQEQSYFIYPNIYVHNFDLITMGSAGTFILGAIEISNVVNVMLGAIVSLSWYATEYFRSKLVYNYEFSEEDSKLTIEQLCLQNADVIEQTRNYFDTKRRLLNNLHQDLIKAGKV
jgi:hypothetical protein